MFGAGRDVGAQERQREDAMQMKQPLRLLLLALYCASRCDAFAVPGVARASSSHRVASHAAMKLVQQVSLGPAVAFLFPVFFCWRRCSQAMAGLTTVRHVTMPQVNTAQFEEAIQDCSTPIVVDIYAVW